MRFCAPSVPAVPLVPPAHLPVQGYRDTWDPWDTIQCVSVALGNGTLRGLTSLTSREAVGAASPPATGVIVGLKSWSTKDSSGWDTLRRPSFFYHRFGARGCLEPRGLSHPGRFC